MSAVPGRIASVATLTLAASLVVTRSAGAEGVAPRRPVVVLDAPSNLGLRPPSPGHDPGVAKLAGALRAHGLLAHLGATDGGAVVPPPYRPEPDPGSWYRNGAGLAEYSPRLADRIAALVAEKRFVVVLGGDCSILIGATLGLRSLGRYGLVFIDGHDDFSPLRKLEEYRGRVTAAGLDLAVVTGHSPGDLGGLRGLGPYVREEDAVLFGYHRSADDHRDFATERVAATAIHAFDREAIRALGPAAAARAALAALAGAPLDGIWIHLDADVLNAELMPAVDSPSPGGLSFGELEDALSVFLADPRVVGLELTIYDPELDPSGRAGDELEATLATSFANAGLAARPAKTGAAAAGGPKVAPPPAPTIPP